MAIQITTIALAALLCVCAQGAAQAQSQQRQPQSAQGAASPAQPKSNLGKEVPAGQAQPTEQITMPTPGEVVDETIKDIEQTQLTDAQYDRLKQIYIRRERQKAMPYQAPAKPITRTLAINLDPGVSPPVLRLSTGLLSSIVFSDASGQPWIIADVRFNHKLFGDGNADEKGGQGAVVEPTNGLSLEPLSPTAYGNISVRLKGLPTPIIFMLTAGQQEVDLRVDAKIPGHNPDAVDSVNFTSMPNIDVSLTSFLDGVPPKDARRLTVTGLDHTDAWLFQENLYVRTDADVQYPAYIGAARSTSGKAVYRFSGQQNSVTVLTTSGRAVTVFIEDPKDNQ